MQSILFKISYQRLIYPIKLTSNNIALTTIEQELLKYTTNGTSISSLNYYNNTKKLHYEPLRYESQSKINRFIKYFKPLRIVKKLPKGNDNESNGSVIDDNNDNMPIALKNENLYENESLLSEKKKNEWTFIFKILGFLRGYILPIYNPDVNIRRNIWKTYGWLILSKTCFFSMPLCLKYGVNLLSAQTTIPLGISMFALYGILNGFSHYSDNRRNMLIAQTIQSAWKQISMITYEHLLKLDVSYHLSGLKSNLFSIHKAKKGIESNLKFLSSFFVPTFIEFTLSSLFLFFYAGPQYFLIFMSSFLAYTAYTVKYSKVRKDFVSKQKEQDKIADFLVSEALANYHLIKYFNAEKIETAKYESILDKYSNYAIENSKALAKLNTGQRIIFAAGLSINLICAAFGVAHGVLTPGDLFMLQALMVQIFTPLNNLGNMYREWVDSYYEIKELFRILDQKPKITDSPNAKDYEYKGGEVELRNVTFGYFPNKPILRNVSFKIPANSWVSVVGESGVGKSSILNLIFRMYDPQNGDIFLDGQNLKDLKLDSFREKITVVSQNSILFNDSVLNNLLYANPLRTTHEIMEVCKKLNLHSKIMSLPQGYNSLVGDQGSKFSGGERQRLSIARCLLKDTPILLLDEITAALDTFNENKVLEILNSMKKKKTIFFITHKLQMNEYSDLVVMIKTDGGVDVGTHDELSKNSKAYQELWNSYLERNNEIEDVNL